MALSLMTRWRPVLALTAVLACRGAPQGSADIVVFGRVWTRRTLDGKHPEGWVPEQKITVEEALRAYPTGSAYALFAEARRGKLACPDISPMRCSWIRTRRQFSRRRLSAPGCGHHRGWACRI